MKKLLSVFVLSFCALFTMAQMNIWYQGEIVYQRALSSIDSITFGQGSEPIVPPQPQFVTPDLPNPGAGKTTIAFYAEVCPNGAYLVGHINGWNVNDPSYNFTPVSGYNNWWALTVDYDADFAGKIIAFPDDQTVPLSWSYQWGKNYEAECIMDPISDNVIIHKGTGVLELENCGEPKLVNLADNSVIYIEIKDWKASPVIEHKKAETAWAKTNWNGDNWWSWKQMTPLGDGVFEILDVWGGNGFNINTQNNDENAQWYALDYKDFDIEDGAQAGDSIKLTFTSKMGAIGTLKLEVLKQAPVIPAGNGSFYVKILNRTHQEGDYCIFTGNFEVDSWGASNRTMFYNANLDVWRWTGDYPANFEYKVIYNDKWATGENVKFDGTTNYVELYIED